MGLEEKMKALPESPGVYIFKDSRGRPLYVGKALSLRNRVRSYFQTPSSLTPKVRAMVEKVRDLDWLVTSSETEALILENNLIKRHSPRFNVHLKDMAIQNRTQIMAEIGEGNLNWPRILDACRKAGVEWYIVEQDTCERDPFESLAISLRNLKAMGIS
ncbi:MAG: GIY-YIG nuclease family protein [Armatimonadetes bacterium]|nr:GIY-YIG nuclease family protein [Armatimonadota bacterium]